MTATDLLEITEMASTQSGRAATANEAFAAFETVGGFVPAIDVNLNTPPGSPAGGDVYIIGDSPTGAWAGHAQDIARYYNGSWRFYPARTGMMAYAANEDILYRFKTAYGWDAAINVGDTVSATQTDFWSGHIETVTDKDYWLAINLPFAVTILSVTTKCASGSGTLTVTIDGTPLGGSANDISSAEDTETHGSANVAGIGADVKMTAACDSPAPVDMAFLVKYTYQLS